MGNGRERFEVKVRSKFSAMNEIKNGQMSNPAGRACRQKKGQG
jgi:hypothetical protein